MPHDTLEQEHSNFAASWLASDAEIFRIAKPDVPNIHLVSYFLLIDPAAQEFLLVDHKKAGLWLPAGGHVEPGEHPKTTVIREAKEELGIDAEFLFEAPQFLSVSQTVGNMPPHTDVSFWYLLRCNRQTLLTIDKEEFHQARWFHHTGIPYERTDPHMKRCVLKVLKKIATQNSYDLSVNEYTSNTAHLHPAAQAQRFLNSLPKAAKILDMGCGPGRDAKIFSEQRLEVTGIDFSQNMIDAARQNAPLAKFILMDVEHLTFPAEIFDGIWASAIFLHIPKQNFSKILARIHTILKPGGLFYFSVKQGENADLLEGDMRYGGLEKYWSFYTLEQLTCLLQKAGFRIVETVVENKKTHYDTHPFIKIFAEKV